MILFSKKISAILMFPIFFFCLHACGYHFAGHYSSLPPEIKTIYIPLFANKTYEPGIENLFTNALIREFIKSNKVDVVRGEAEGVISGEIISFKLDPLSYTKDDRVLEYRAIIKVSAAFRKADTGEVIWKNENLSHNEEYMVSSDMVSTEAGKKGAKEKIVEELAERIHDSILEGM